MKTTAMRMLGAMLCVACLGSLMLPAPAQEPKTQDERIPNGKGEVMIALGSYRLKLFTYRPKNYRAATGPLILVFHGHSRNPDSYRDHAVGLGDECGGLIVAPFFDEKQFPGQAYNHGNVMAKGVVQPREQWTFSLIPKLIDKVCTMEERAEMPYYLLGHSGGGQFVERLMAFTELKPVRAVAANPGSHLFPNKTLDFPYGFAGLSDALSGDNALKAYLAAPMTLYLGTADTDPNHPQLDKSKLAEKQGPHRLARGRQCYELAKDLAAARGWDFKWRLVEAPEIDHSAGKMFSHLACQDALFGKRAAPKLPSK
jgi:poly(3-hydroxybutyrate) depolymerase